MIVSASYRTDIPAFYRDWFMGRIAAGYCDVANPYGGQTARVDLTPEAAEGIVLWTRNLGPMQGDLGTLARDYAVTVQYTITGYPRALERSTPPTETAIADLRAAARRLGPRACVWRYDPILISDITPSGWHVANFAVLARQLRGSVDEVVVSFAHLYVKTRRNLDRAAARYGLSWRDPDITEKRAILADLAGIAATNGMRLTVCSQPDLLIDAGMGARCIDAARLSDVAGRPIAAPPHGNRPGCLCHRSRDIGAYDTCPHGCAYCYAVRRTDAAKRAYAGHDAAAEKLNSG